ncbi:patatin-like phospholipase family protein [Paenibacillus sp. 1011MAR3C5]|uniref:patatin-like phospholipase family protein n=1 Tax=Paenibacillus sp. 1011MAR3C5 TaxID=1675787 RepID=UPI000E6BAF41|nr:patatin-like phospholipase family protein [Paenibacillus sp. 1011MAR3C5]RJE90901.1 patatin-like phospholipase family protein [Paenibacillus sp. 1011MAR3C5]
MTSTNTGKLALALEGGGAKGAYHMGVMKAYQETGQTFDAIAGTSIGALNGAVIAQGDFEIGYQVWERLNARSIFDISDEEYRLLMRRKLDTAALRHLASRTKRLIADRGMDTQKMRLLMESLVDESRLRASAVDFGLVTVSLSDRAPLELYKEDIPQGRVLDYLMASAAFPGFQTTYIDDKAFIDGGLYDNCPINMLARKGYTSIVAVRTLGFGVTRKIRYPGLTITTISPSEPLGGMMSFNPETIRRSMSMGYYDALRQLRGLQGRTYCIDIGGFTEEACDEMLASLPDAKLLALGRMLGASGIPARELWSRVIVPRLSRSMRLPADASSITFIVRLAEVLASAKGINKYAVYRFPDWVRSTINGPLKNVQGLGFRQVELCMAAQRILEGIRL